MVKLERNDIVRHRLVQNIVDAYELNGDGPAVKRQARGGRTGNNCSASNTIPAPASAARRSARTGTISKRAPAPPIRGLIPSLGIVAGFWLAITLLLLLRKDVVPYRPGDYVPHDIVARVDFQFLDQALHDQQVKVARENAPRVYRRVPGDIWAKIQVISWTLPDTVHGRAPQELDPPAA